MTDLNIHQPSRSSHQLLLRARVVLPVARPPIENGAVLIKGNQVVSVGRWPDFSSVTAEGADLGEVVLMPGLVNAHCHLDYTNMAGQFPPPKYFTDWIKSITATKADWTYSDFAQSWLSGAGMLVRTGTTMVADIENVPLLLPEVWEATPLRVFSFLEMTGIKSRRQPRSILHDAEQWIEKLSMARLGKLEARRTDDKLEARPTADRLEPCPTFGSRCCAGLSPHAPYSTLPELLRLTAATARRRGWRLCTHLA